MERPHHEFMHLTNIVHHYQNLDGLTVPGLKNVAAQLGIKTTSKTNKAQLKQLVFDHGHRQLLKACAASDQERRTLYDDLLAAHVDEKHCGYHLYILFTDGEISQRKANLLGRSVFTVKGSPLTPIYPLLKNLFANIGPLPVSESTCPCIYAPNFEDLQPLQQRLIRMFLDL